MAVIEHLLEIHDLTVEFLIRGEFAVAVDHVSLTLESGKVLCLVGESGCGKSVTSMSILGLLPQNAAIRSSGEILFMGQNILGLPEKQLNRIRASEISVVFQDPSSSLNPAYTIEWQLVESIRTGKKINRRQAVSQARELLEMVGIPDPERRMKEYPHQLSGGMKQRVMIAMALSKRPKLLIADEPTTALDVTVQAQILDIMRSLQKQLGTAILFVTHDMGVVAEMADQIAVMYAGQIVEQDDADGVFHAPAHPYTQGLLRSVLRPDRRAEKLSAIRGMAPQLGEIQAGCRFAGRCDECRALCSEENPPLAAIGPKQVRCWKYSERWDQDA